MLLVQTCRVPENCLSLSCGKWLAAIRDRLDGQQLEYLEKLRQAKAAPGIYAARLLARLLLLSSLPMAHNLYSDKNGLPRLRNEKYASCFAYAYPLVVSALYAPEILRTKPHLGVDVEPMKKLGADQEGFASLRQLKNWLKFEIALKAASGRPHICKMSKINIYKREDFEHENFAYAFIPIPGNVIAVGCNLPLPKKIFYRHLNVRKLNSPNNSQFGICLLS